MPRQATKYTDEQRDALATAVLDRGLATKQVRAYAAAGTLQDGIEPFDVPESTIRDCASRVRRRREGEARSHASKLEPRAALRELFERVVSALEYGLEYEERKARMGRADPIRLGQFGKTLRDLTTVGRELDTTPAAEPAKPAANGKRRHAATLADDMLEETRRETRGGVPSEGYAHTHIGSTDHPDLDTDSGDGALASLSTDDQAIEHARADSAHAHDSRTDEPALRAAAGLRARMAHA